MDDREAELEQEIVQLKSGMKTRSRVGMALGILMERFGLDEDLAFDLLVRVSQSENRKMHLVAEEVIGGRDLAHHDDPSVGS